MRFKLSTALISLVACLSISMAAQEIRGDYLETRSADVYTGQCFTNGEVNLVGNEAILAWHVQSGSWGGVPLQGLTVAAAVRARGTLGDPYENPYPAKAVLLVDDQEHHGAAMLRAGRFATVQTRSIGSQDHLCGNEETFYPPLTQLAHSVPAVALTDAYGGPGLGVSWDLHGKRSAFVGTFAR